MMHMCCWNSGTCISGLHGVDILGSTNVSSKQSLKILLNHQPWLVIIKLTLRKHICVVHFEMQFLKWKILIHVTDSNNKPKLIQTIRILSKSVMVWFTNRQEIYQLTSTKVFKSKVAYIHYLFDAPAITETINYPAEICEIQWPF